MPLALPPELPQAEIVITARALPEAKSERVYSTEVIGRQRIEQSPTRELDQLLKEVPGLQLFRRSDARSGHPTSQGVILRALGGNASSRALLVLDGVPQSDPFGGWINWPAYDPLDLEQVRVIRGGGSVANGPGALAGTIEMRSRSDAGVTGELDAGSRSSIEGSGRAAFRAGNSLLSLSGQAGRSDGFIPITEGMRGPADERAPYREWNGRARVATPVSSSINLHASLDAFHDWRTRGTDFSANRTNGADASVRLVSDSAWQWSALAYWQWRNFRGSFASVDAERTKATRVLLQDSVPSHGLGGSVEVRPPMPPGIELRIGADARRTDGETHEFFTFVAGEPTRTRRAGGETWTVGAYGEVASDVGKAIITGGVRIDRWQVNDGHLTETMIATGAGIRDERYRDRSGWLPTARAGVSTPIGSNLSVRSAAYLGWRMPTLNELFRPFRAGLDATAANAALDPEKLAGVEAGIDYAKGPVRLALTGFANRLKDAIANVTLDHGPGTFDQVGFVPAGGSFSQRQNVDAVEVHGVEGSAEWWSGPWSVRAGASWTHARTRSSGAAASLDGLRPAQTPNFAASLAAGWEHGGRGAQIVLRHVGRQFDDDLNTDILKAATTVDAYASWPLTKRLQIVARAENITNAFVMAGINGDGSIERATPRTVWIGLRLR